MAGERLVEMMRQHDVKPDEYPEVLFGTVRSTKPLTIDIEGTQGAYTIDADTFQIILHECVKRKVVEYDYPKITYDSVTPSVTINGDVTGNAGSTGSVGAFYVQNITGYDTYYAVTDFTGDTWVNRSFIRAVNMESRLIEPSLRVQTTIELRHNLSGVVDEELPTNFKVEDEKREIVLWEDLSPGETVRVIRAKKAQLYYVIGRGES